MENRKIDSQYAKVIDKLYAQELRKYFMNK